MSFVAQVQVASGAAGRECPPSQQMLHFGATTMLEDDALVTASGYNFSPQEFVTCTLKVDL